MAWNFSGFGESFEATAAPFSAYPITVACWFKIDGPDHRMLAFQYESGDGDNGIGMKTGPTTNTLQAYVGPFPIETATTVNTTATGVWAHGVAVFASSTSRRVVLNGDFANEGVDTDSKDFPSATNRISVATGPINYTPHDGIISHVCWWAAVLNTNEITALAAGIHPWRVRPESIRPWYPMDVPTDTHPKDYGSGAYHLSTIGSTPDFDPAGPPVELWSPGRKVFEPFVPAAAVVGDHSLPAQIIRRKVHHLLIR